jgi:3-hydroxyacyl-[acyl-carrier-protein] dehydratase
LNFLPRSISATGWQDRRAFAIPMQYSLIDRIVELRPKQALTAIKCLSLAEEYLADHFPLFPVMPGVLMLEALTQSAAWLIRASEDFAHSMVVLREARNVKYADFVEPGEVLTLRVEQLRQNERRAWFKAAGTVDDRPAVTARLEMERYNLADTCPARAALDAFTRQRMRNRFDLLTRGGPIPSHVG